MTFLWVEPEWDQVVYLLESYILRSENWINNHIVWREGMHALSDKRHNYYLEIIYSIVLFHIIPLGEL